MGYRMSRFAVLEGSRSVGNRQRVVGKKDCPLPTADFKKASLKIRVAYVGETSRNSAAHLRPVG